MFNTLLFLYMNTPSVLKTAACCCLRNCEVGLIHSYLLRISNPFQMWIQYVHYFLFYFLLVTETNMHVVFSNHKRYLAFLFLQIPSHFRVPLPCGFYACCLCFCYIVLNHQAKSVELHFYFETSTKNITHSHK